ncbi:bifunctional protein HldE [Spirochaetia bacterium]|nr:bifunctional protein HldE [Spirochaetia bacterium]
MNIEKIKEAKVLVIGDIMLDTYYIGNVKRISPEAPVPIVNISEQYNTLGGAANVAKNLIGLGSKVFVIGAVGEDSNGRLLKKEMTDINIKSTLIQVEQQTINKIRIIGNNQQIARVDFENDEMKLNANDEKCLIEAIEKQIPLSDVVIISDYGKGICNDEICKSIISNAKKYNEQVIVDPKGIKWNKYSNATIITPNLKELSDISGFDLKNENEIIYNEARKLIDTYKFKYVLVTRSDKGMTLVGKDTCNHINTEAIEVFDVSGAGDTVVAVLAAALSADFNFLDAVTLSNKAASIVVGKKRTSPVLFNELNQSLFKHEKIWNFATSFHLNNLLNFLHEQNKKIVFTNGCFDIIHKGHIYYLREAKNLGDILIIGLNSDDSIKRIKGPSRPVNNEEARAFVLDALEFVDYVVIFPEDTPYNLIKEIHPDVLVKGGDYNIKDIVGREFAKETVTIKFQDGYSSSGIIKSLKDNEL